MQDFLTRKQLIIKSSGIGLEKNILVVTIMQIIPRHLHYNLKASKYMTKL